MLLAATYTKHDAFIQVTEKGVVQFLAGARTRSNDAFLAKPVRPGERRCRALDGSKHDSFAVVRREGPVGSVDYGNSEVDCSQVHRCI